MRTSLFVHFITKLDFNCNSNLSLRHISILKQCLFGSAPYLLYKGIVEFDSVFEGWSSVFYRDQDFTCHDSNVQNVPLITTSSYIGLETTATRGSCSMLQWVQLTVVTWRAVQSIETTTVSLECANILVSQKVKFVIIGHAWLHQICARMGSRSHTVPLLKLSRYFLYVMSTDFSVIWTFEISVGDAKCCNFVATLWQHHSEELC